MIVDMQGNPAPEGMIGICNCQAQRQTAKSVLAGLIQRKHEEIQQLQVLLDNLPHELPQDADMALWKILMKFI